MTAVAPRRCWSTDKICKRQKHISPLPLNWSFQQHFYHRHDAICARNTRSAPAASSVRPLHQRPSGNASTFPLVRRRPSLLGCADEVGRVNDAPVPGDTFRGLAPSFTPPSGRGNRLRIGARAHGVQQHQSHAEGPGTFSLSLFSLKHFHLFTKWIGHSALRSTALAGRILPRIEADPLRRKVFDQQQQQ